MTEHMNGKHLVCDVCGQDIIGRQKPFYIKKRGEKGYSIVHGDCIALYESKRKRVNKKSK